VNKAGRLGEADLAVRRGSLRVAGASLDDFVSLACQDDPLGFVGRFCYMYGVEGDLSAETQQKLLEEIQIGQRGFLEATLAFDSSLDNFEFDKNEPETIRNTRLRNEPFKGKWDKQRWRYYRWSYYRNIEHVDAEIGRVLRAIEDSGHINDTLIVMTSDHGEGMGHHQMVRKSSLYNEASRVPLLFSWPGHIPSKHTDTTHLASGMDIMPTLCDFAGIEPPEHMRGRSLKSILDGTSTRSSEFVITEVSTNTGRMVRTKDYKYITYRNDSVEQLFDMKNDPGETLNLAAKTRYSSTLAEHQKLLREFERRLDVPSNVPNSDVWQKKI